MKKLLLLLSTVIISVNIHGMEHLKKGLTREEQKELHEMLTKEKAKKQKALIEEALNILKDKNAELDYQKTMIPFSYYFYFKSKGKKIKAYSFTGSIISIEVNGTPIKPLLATEKGKDLLKKITERIKQTYPDTLNE